MLAKKCVNLVLIAVVVLFGAGGAYAQTAQQIAQKAFDSTVLLVMEDANGQQLSLGSGFFIGNGQIASNFHVIEGASRGYAKLIDGDTKYDIDGVLAVDMKHDLVILKVSAQSPALSLGDSEAVQIGDSVYAVGNPKGLEGTFSQGIISSIREIESANLLQITAPISPGSSGGPVLNGKGEVIGVSVATFRGGQNLNFAIPADYLTTLKNQIKTATNAKPLAKIKTDKNRNSILDDWQGQEDDSVVGGKFAWDDAPTQYIGLSSTGYSFSIRNKLRTNIKSVMCLIIFYDSHGDPIDVAYVEYKSVVPAGLARRVEVNRLFGIINNGKVEKIAKSTEKIVKKGGSVAIRILDFQLIK